jgi:CDP-paratose 2-epimerase
MFSRPSLPAPIQRVLITGGAGFIGTNAAIRFVNSGVQVRILDNLSRNLTDRNLQFLNEEYSGRIEFMCGDVRDYETVSNAVENVDVVLHLAAQVAVTSSITDPRTDFEINAGGTLNVLEAVRTINPGALVLFTSTNKVYGGLPDVCVVEEPSRYRFRDLKHGVDETRPLDFHSPYGCSKGAADQYVRDFARIFGLRTVVFRMSCIYGPHQFGSEDQGWVAYFVRAALEGASLSVYGDGKQVRDVLYVDDLIDAFICAMQHAERASGEVFNIGGGPERTVSVWKEFAELLREGPGIPQVRFGDWRVGDQKVYISDIRKAVTVLGWEPGTSFSDGLRSLTEWTADELGILPL